MRDIVWLASYPKSGNTWLRLLISGLTRDADAVDINETAERNDIASARGPFDNRLLIDSGLLTHDEIDDLRPRLHEEIARDDREDDEASPRLPVRFAKVHDAYLDTPSGEALLAGARGARAAIVIVRDPRDIVPSLANHLHRSIDEAIGFLNDPAAVLSGSARQQQTQLRQRLSDWSGHVASWLDQRELAVHLLRYEDLQADAAAALTEAMEFAGVAAAPRDVARAVALASFEKLQAQEKRTGFKEWSDRRGQGALFFRRGESGAWRDELTDEQARRVEMAHGAMMARLGYAPSPSPSR